MTTPRPTHKELTGKLEKARELVADGLVKVLTKAVPEIRELDLLTPEEVLDGLTVALSEIEANDYAGGRPPMRSYEPKLHEAELFAFAFESEKFGCRMYLKFAFHGKPLRVVSFHRERKGRR